MIGNKLFHNLSNLTSFVFLYRGVSNRFLEGFITILGRVLPPSQVVSPLENINPPPIYLNYYWKLVRRVGWLNSHTQNHNPTTLLVWKCTHFPTKGLLYFNHLISLIVINLQLMPKESFFFKTAALKISNLISMTEQSFITRLTSKTLN